MIVRNLDVNHDWTFGAGKNNYRTNLNALAQNIQTRLLCFLGDCYFDLTAGIAWWFYLGSRNRQQELQMEVANVILSTQNVIGIEKLNLDLDSQRKISLTYTVDTALGRLDGEIFYNI